MGNSYCAYTKVNFQETAEQKSAQSAFIRAIRVQGFDCKITPRNTHHAPRASWKNSIRHCANIPLAQPLLEYVYAAQAAAYCAGRTQSISERLSMSDKALIMYSRTIPCPDCERARALLTDNAVPFREVMIDL